MEKLISVNSELSEHRGNLSITQMDENNVRVQFNLVRQLHSRPDEIFSNSMTLSIKSLSLLGEQIIEFFVQQTKLGR